MSGQLPIFPGFSPVEGHGRGVKAVWCLGLWGLLGCDPGPRPSAEACAGLEARWSVEAIPSSRCVAAPEPRDLRDRPKLAVAVYHFNIQYVAGGLRGFPDGILTETNNYSEAETEDRIVRQGIEPVIDLLLANPSFAADLELQAYTIEIIATRHPDVLDKLKILVERGQIEVDSFHYSDQLYVAYPRRDLEASLDLVQAVFDRACLPRGASIFTQEGQFAVGQLPLARDRGYRVSVLPKNLYSYQFGEGEPVLFSDPAVPAHTVILGGRGFSGSNASGPFQLTWTFMDDGEIAFSKNRLNPYFGTDFVVDPAAIAKHVDELKAQEAAGYTHATIREAVLAMEGRGFVPSRLPPVLDGTWQPKDTGNVLRWMGGGGLFRAQERDSEVLAAVWRARTAVERAERQLPQASGLLRRGLDAAWREVALAAVSDSTGWNPFINEVLYAIDKSVESEGITEQVLACAGLSPEPVPAPVCTPISEPPSSFGLEVVAPARAVTTTMLECAPLFGGRRLLALEVDVPQTSQVEQNVDDTELESEERQMDIVANWSGDRFGLVQALESTPREQRLDDYRFERMTIPLPIGLIGLGQDRWLIQDQATSRLGATLDRSAQGRGQLRFVDQTMTRVTAVKRRYYLAEGLSPTGAAGLAERINRPNR